MYLVQDTHNRFLKRNADNKITFTNSESLADVFPSEREANDYIRKTFGKKARKKYRAVRSENDSSPELIPFNHTMSEVSTEKYKLGIESIDEEIQTHLDPEIEKYIKKLQGYDGMILDIRHWLRDENTKLNVCQGYQVVKRLQDIERERASCKKELQRVTMLRDAVKKACRESVSFEYNEYKNRQIEDVRAFIFKDSNH